MRDAPSYESRYIQIYDANNSKQTLGGHFLQKGHFLLEKTLPSDVTCGHVLEVGAGTGHHFQYVKHAFQQYVMTDNNETMLEMATKKYSDQSQAGMLAIENQDAEKLGYPDHSFDRLIAAFVLHHLPNPVVAMREWNRVVKPNGIISILLPCDPGVLWRLGRCFGPRRNAVKMGLAYDYADAVGHLNSIFNLVVFIRHHFEFLSESWYPARISAPDLNLFYSCHIRTTP